MSDSLRKKKKSRASRARDFAASVTKTKIGGALNDVDQIRSGISAVQYEKIAESVGLSGVQLAKKLGIAPRTLATRKLVVLKPRETEKAMRADRILAEAEKVFGSNAEAIIWLNSPQRGLEGQTPIDLLDTDVGAGHVQEYLSAIKYGNVW
jgi:putative toxin-antitoxin system antitoxin component (TIGR02293 family)